MAPHRTTTDDSRQNWRTPPWLFTACASLLGVPFALDAAADELNTLCDEWCDGETADTDGLVTLWSDPTWVNPPFDRTAEFILKALVEAERGVRSVLLITASTENKYWEPALESPYLRSLVFITGRVPFIHPVTGKPVKNNVAGSALMFFGPDTLGTTTKWVQRDALRDLGNGSIQKLP